MNDKFGLRDYIAQLVEKDLRIDGRKLTEYRKPIKVELNISKNAEGSAKVTIGNTEVIAGVKLDVGAPFPDTGDEGNLITSVELLALSSAEFQPGPPDAQTIELARIIDRGVRESNMIDMKKLCIKKDELVWTVFIDIYTINDDGNLIDAAALASVVALKNAVFPKLEKDKVNHKEFTKNKLPIEKIPVTCTLIKINDKILVDPTIDEEKVSDARLSIAISSDDTINALQKGGDKGINSEEIEQMIEIALEKTKELRDYIK